MTSFLLQRLCYLVVQMDTNSFECNVALHFWSQGKTVKRPGEYKLPAIGEVYTFIDIT